VGWHAVDTSPFEKGDSVLIVGGGPIGLATIQALRARHAGKIIVSEVSAKRKEFARRIGADFVFDPTKDEIVAQCRKLCNGQGVDVVFDAAGVQNALGPAILAMRARGTLLNIAVSEQTASIVPNDLLFKEKRYMGVACYAKGNFQAVIDAISEGKLAPADMITKKVKLDNVVEEGFET
jgi:threonine dehydrogenase-like Zn-dependent dehydrogenase